jgi:uncharacterized protein
MGERVTIGIVSDTHSWLDPQLLEMFHGVDRILHAGDIGDMAVLEALEQVAPVISVRGNIDGGEFRHLPLTHVEEVCGKRLGLLHIAGNPNRPTQAARKMLAKERLDVLIVGHSHIPVVGRVGQTLWLNPGAAGREGFHDLRFALLLHIDSETGELALDRLHLGTRASAYG